MDDRYQTSLSLIKRVHYNVNQEGRNDDDESYVVDGGLYSNLGNILIIDVNQICLSKM
jgi:hypothetical protein